MRLRSTRLTGATVLAIIATIAPQMGCSSSKDKGDAPYINVFYPSQPVVNSGGTTTVNLIGYWKNGTGVVDHGVGPIENNTLVPVTPQETTTYTLTVTNAEGKTATMSCTIKVAEPPAIASFTANPTKVKAGETTNLTAVFDANCTAVVSIDQGATVGTIVSGVALPVVISGPTTFVLTVTNQDGGYAVMNLVVALASDGPGNYTTDMSPSATLVAPTASSWTSPTAIQDPTNNPGSSWIPSGGDKLSWGNWPTATEDSVEYDYAAPVTLGYSSVYWRQDGGAGTPVGSDAGGIGAPSSYTVQYWDDVAAAFVDVKNPFTATLVSDVAGWSAVSGVPVYSLSYDEYDSVGFDPVTTTKIRLLMEPRAQNPGPSALAICRWKVYGGYPLTPTATGGSK